MFRKIALLSIGIICIPIGIAGLAIPFLPGFIFLLIAAVCFAALSPALHHRLSAHPRLSRFFRRLEAGKHLNPYNRVKLAIWASLEVVGGHRSNKNR